MKLDTGDLIKMIAGGFSGKDHRRINVERRFPSEAEQLAKKEAAQAKRDAKRVKRKKSNVEVARYEP